MNKILEVPVEIRTDASPISGTGTLRAVFDVADNECLIVELNDDFTYMRGKDNREAKMDLTHDDGLIRVFWISIDLPEVDFQNIENPNFGSFDCIGNPFNERMGPELFHFEVMK